MGFFFSRTNEDTPVGGSVCFHQHLVLIITTTLLKLMGRRNRCGRLCLDTGRTSVGSTSAPTVARLGEAALHSLASLQNSCFDPPAEVFCIQRDLVLFQQLFSPRGGKHTLDVRERFPSEDGNVLSSSDHKLDLP